MPLSHVKEIVAREGHLACTPPESLAIKKDIEKGFARAAQKTQLLCLEVVFRSGSNMPGDRVFISHENTTLEWIKRTYMINGKEFILVPESAVLMVEQGVEVYIADEPLQAEAVAAEAPKLAQ